MPELIYDHGSRSPFGGHPLFRKRPSFIGQPTALANEFQSPHTLQIAVLHSQDGMPTRISRQDIIRTVKKDLNILSIYRGFDFYDAWVLLYGSISDFDEAGILLFGRERTEGIAVPVVVEEALTFLGPISRPGRHPYSPQLRSALSVVGAQLRHCEKLMRRMQAGQSKPARDDVIAEITPHLGPLRNWRRNKTQAKSTDEQRLADGAIGMDDQLYKTLWQEGAALWEAIDASGSGVDEICQSLEAPSSTGAAFETTKIGLEMLDAAVSLACAAFTKDKAAQALELASNGPSRQVFTVNASIANGLVVAAEAEQDNPDVFALTRLAFLWGINAAEYIGDLQGLSLHFAAARFLGKLHRAERSVELDAAAHWGCRALSFDLFDTLLDPDMLSARVWLNQFMLLPPEVLDLKPQTLPPAADARLHWRHRQMRTKIRSTSR